MILPRPRRSWPWSGVVLLAAALVSLPILTVLSSLARPEWALWAHLARTQLPELLLNTLGLVTAVGLGVLVLGTTLAWLVVTCEFPGRRLFEWALVLPLALPAYVIGFVFLGLFEYAGPIQTTLRGWLGPGARLPDLRSGWGVALMMTLVYYPYVYTLGRAALAEQAPEFLETARSLGRSAFGGRTCPNKDCEESVLGDQDAASLQCHHQYQARHQAPEARDQRGQEDEFEASAFLPAAEDGVAHNQKWGRQHQQRNGRDRTGTRAGAELVEAQQAAGGQLVAGTAQAGHGKAERQREQHLYRFRGHQRPQRSTRGPSVANGGSARQPILNEW